MRKKISEPMERRRPMRGSVNWGFLGVVLYFAGAAAVISWVALGALSDWRRSDLNIANRIGRYVSGDMR